MDFYMVITLVALLILAVTATFIIRFIRSATKTLSHLDTMIESVRHTSGAAEKTVLTVDETFKNLNDHLPAILEDLSQTAASVRSISGSAEIQLQREVKDEHSPHTSLSVAANISNYVLKGYSVWKRFKRNRLA